MELEYLREKSLESDRAFYTEDIVSKNLSLLNETEKKVKYEIPENELLTDYVLPLRIGWEELDNWFPEAHEEALDVVKDSISSEAIEKLSKHVKETVAFKPIQNRTYKPSDIQKRREGTCSEHSFIYVALARSVGIPTRLVANPGEDHVWAESWDHSKNRWVHVDPSEGIVDDPDFYEREWNKDISYVYAPKFDGSIEDITKTYTETGTLEFDNECMFTVISKWWSTEKAKKAKKGFDGLAIATFRGTSLEIGDGIYDIIVQSGRLSFLYSDIEVKVGQKKKLELS